jgi:hypothetical protein
VALHPNGLDLARFSWVVMVEVLFRNAWAGGTVVDLGLEFAPFSMAQWSRWMLGASAMALAAWALAWRGRRDGQVPLAFALGTVLFAALTARTARFAEYFVPFSVVALALSVQGLGRRARLVLPAAAMAASLAYSGGPLLETVEELHGRKSRLTPGFAAALREKIPPGSQVFTCEWGHTGTLMLALPDRRFLVALDPTLFQLKDPELYRLWVRLRADPPEGVAQVIRDRFGARFVVCFWDEPFRKLTNRLAFEPGVRTLFLADDWNVYELGDPPPEEAGPSSPPEAR